MEAAVVVLKWSQTAVVLLEGCMQGVLVSMTCLDDFSNWGCNCCYVEHLRMDYFGSGHGHVLNSAPLGDYLTDN